MDQQQTHSFLSLSVAEEHLRVHLDVGLLYGYALPTPVHGRNQPAQSYQIHHYVFASGGR